MDLLITDNENNNIIINDLEVIIVHDNASVTGGAQKVAITEAKALAEIGVKVTYFAAVGPVDPLLNNTNIEVICLEQKELKDNLNSLTSKLSGIIRGMYNKNAFEKLDLLLQQRDPQKTIVHVHGWSLALSSSIFKAIRNRNFKVLITCHDYELSCPTRGYFNYRTNKMCKIPGMTAQCICTNCDKRSYMQKVYRVLRQFIFYHYIKKCNLKLIYLSEFNKKIVEKYNRINLEGYIVPNLIDIPRETTIDAWKNQTYLYIGRLNPEKGGNLFCEATTKAKVPAEVIGTGSQLEELKEKYPNVKFWGWKTASEMLPIVKKARCMIMSSIWYEGAPLTIPEIECAYAIPWIVPSPSGAVDYIKHGINGYIYQSGDVNQLISCIEKTKDDCVIKAMVEKNRNLNKEQYSKNTHIRNLLSVYKKVLNDYE